MKFNIYREISIYHYEMKNYKHCLKNLEKALNIKNVDNQLKQRTIIDFCYTLKKRIEFGLYNYDDINKDIILIKEKINQLNEIIEKPLDKNLYYEAHKAKNKIYKLFKPDIVMLNSNPLKTKNNYFFPLNNQYYILNKLKKNLNSNIRIKSKILNIDNLKEALNEKGKILIIQSDEFTNDGDIVCECENGKSSILKKEDFYELIKNKKNFFYDLIILCFPKSSRLKEYLNLNLNFINNYFWITFEYFDDTNINNHIMKELNTINIQFLIDFIKYSIIYNGDKITSIFELAKKNFLDEIKLKKIDISCKEYIILSKQKSNNDLRIEYKLEEKENEIYLYENLPDLNISEIDYNFDYQDYSSQIYDLIEYLKSENKIIFYCDVNSKKFYLKMCGEIIKFFYRHETFYEIYCINIYKDGISFLKSLVRRLNKLKIEEHEEDDSEDEEENIESKKACLILIYNCTSQDLIDVNIFSILDCNSSFIIIYDKEKNLNNNNTSNNKQALMRFEKFLSEENFLLDYPNDTNKHNLKLEEDIGNKEGLKQGVPNSDDDEKLIDNELMRRQDDISKSNQKFFTEYSQMYPGTFNYSISKVKEIEKWNVVFNRDGINITVTVEENILLSELFKLYLKKSDLHESYINNIIVIYNGIEITKINETLLDCFLRNKNPHLTVIDKKILDGGHL